ncbi:MAG: sodium:proton antiporter [Desulfobulbaceae bacterium]|nr:MAG: sodium:proton antiporter [Desulfobulbaceae bacterium]
MGDTSNPLFILGLILILGFFAGQVANFLKLPRISGYIMTGLLLSPSMSGIFSMAEIEDLFNFTSEMALAIIAYSIGGSLQISRIGVLGKDILWINLCEGLGAFFCTCLAVYILGPLALPDGQDWSTFLVPLLLILGGISVATAPAATMAVIHEMRAKGPLTTTLLGVVALDDALSIIIFSAALTIAGMLAGVDLEQSTALLRGGWQVGGALLIGALQGFLLSFFLTPSKRPEIIILLSLGAIFLVAGLANRLAFSPLLAAMTMAFVVTNRVQHSDDLFNKLDLIEETIFCLFFALAAAHFDLSVLTTSLGLGLILLVGRFAGKLAGTYAGGKISQAPPQVYRYLGFTLMPQAGLSLGLIFLARPILPAALFDLALNAMLASILLNEIISPVLVKWSLVRAGESTTGGD